MKKILFTFVCILFVSLAVRAQSTFVVDGITYHVRSEADDNATFGTVSVVSSEDGFYEGAISIPNAVKNTKSQYADTYKVVAIDNGAFKDCSRLKSVNVSASIETIGDNAFENCTNLETVTFATGNLKSIGGCAFQNSGLKQIAIPEGITELKARLFYECTTLSEVKLPSSLKTIEDDVFSYCKSLKAIDLPKGLQNLGSCFQQSGVVNIKLPVKVVNVPNNCFLGCKSLTTVELSSYTNTLGNNAFSGCSYLTSISLPQDIKTISIGCFNGCTSLKSVSLPTSLRIIDKYAFSGCASLEAISLPNDVDSIGGSAFEGCTNLKTVSLSSKLKNITAESFSGCTSLVSITLPQSIESIGYGAFKGCTALTKINGLSETANVNGLAFDKCPLILNKTYDNLSIKSKDYKDITITKIEFKDTRFFVYITCKIDVKDTTNRIYTVESWTKPSDNPEYTDVPSFADTPYTKPINVIHFPKKLTVQYNGFSKKLEIWNDVETDPNKQIDGFDLDIRTSDKSPFDTHFRLACNYMPINIHTISIYNEAGKAIFENVKF